MVPHIIDRVNGEWTGVTELIGPMRPEQSRALQAVLQQYHCVTGAYSRYTVGSTRVPKLAILAIPGVIPGYPESIYIYYNTLL